MSRRINQLKIILIGKGGSGKDYIRKFLTLERGMKFATGCTSRPRREGETDEYYQFLSREEFERKIAAGEFVQHVEFNGHYYGTLKETFNSCNLFIMNPQGVAALSLRDRRQCLVMMVEASEPILIRRMTARDKTVDLEDVMRRIAIDRKTFEDFVDYDLIIDNDEGKLLI